MLNREPGCYLNLRFLVTLFKGPSLWQAVVNFLWPPKSICEGASEWKDLFVRALQTGRSIYEGAPAEWKDLFVRVIQSEKIYSLPRGFPLITFQMLNTIHWFFTNLLYVLLYSMTSFVNKEWLNSFVLAGSLVVRSGLVLGNIWCTLFGTLWLSLGDR